MKYSTSSTIISFLFFVVYAYYPDDLLAIGALIFGGASFICGAIEKVFNDD